MTEANLYETVNKIYSESTPISRLLFVVKMKEDRSLKDSHVQINVEKFISDIKSNGPVKDGFKFCIISLGSANIIVLVEVN